MTGRPELRAWVPPVPGIAEVLHARIVGHLGAAATGPAGPDRHRLARDLRDLLDERLATGVSLRAAATVLHAAPAHLVRSFNAAYGLPPHRYLTGRQVEAARRRLLDGEPIAAVAHAVGFHDQAHLHRHFTRLVGTTPHRFARTAGEIIGQDEANELSR